MDKRTLTVTLQADWKGELRRAARSSFQAVSYQEETLNFDSPEAFFSHLTDRRWALIRALQEAGGEIAGRELARRIGRDVKRVHEDVGVLVALGVFERSESGGLLCPYADVHVDMHLRHAA